MHLEDVNIEGFKSYSEQTNVSFQPGIGVIIGNNGVGKSNILDAIAWAMGENDLSRLRCLEQDELFFSGSKDYPPAEKVRIELNFKESTEENKPSLQLVRELWKEGRDLYWINDEQIQRENYLRGLEDLKLSQALKTAIKQEQINDMLLLDPWQRFCWVQNFLGVKSKQSLARLLDGEVGSLFREYINYLFPSGEAQLQILQQNGRQGLDIEVTLAGNRKRRAHQLSGGEKSVTSLALKLAIFEQLESPFYLLDEVEPALDYTNHKSMAALLKTLAERKQLIMITHLRSTIQLANTVHGVRTRWDGSSFMKFYFVMDERLLRLYKCC